MPKSWVGIGVTALIAIGVALILYLNVNTGPDHQATAGGPKPAVAPSSPGEGGVPVGFREYPIGDEVSQNGLAIRAVYLPAVPMEGMETMLEPDVLHLEADIVAEAGNVHGFTKDAFVSYLQVDYRIEPAAGGAPIEQGSMVPMIAQDGLHYGTNVSMPRAGEYRLIYTIHPPTKLLGRHSDPVTGVPAWWDTFTVAFEWDYPGPPEPIAAR